MKYIATFLFLIVSATIFSQQIDYNTDEGYLAEGYDLVTYFTQEKPLEGSKKFETTINGVKLKFVSAENLAIFKKNPEKYMPQYGGYCAYAIAAKNSKMDIDAEAYDIRDGKLYLFFNSFFWNKLEDWKEEDTPALQKKGDVNWEILKHKKD